MKKKVLLIGFIIALVFSCTESDDTGGGDGGGTDNFDRAAMQTNLADNIIIPAYQDLNTKLADLVTAKNDFITTADATTLQNFRTSWLTAYKSWQYVEMFNIGKAEEILYHFQMNIYPTNETDIQNNIITGSYDLTHPNNNDAVGFPALDYLLYGVGADDTAILGVYTTDADAAKYKSYLSDIVDQMKSLTETVLNDWTATYRASFISSTSNTASSAVNKMVNDYIFYYEKGLRANKIGIPAGNFSATPLPEKVEAFYNKEASKELASIALTAVQDFFNGKGYTSGTNGTSYNDYLSSLDRSDLVTMINNQYNAARTKINVLDANFYDQVNTDNTKMTEAYDALQMAVVLLKVDMLQAFNISVDYVDADGD